jgi:membrane associated rhomboid family serine protease
VTATDFPRPDANRFGTDAFYAAIGRAFVVMCAFVPVLFVIEMLDVALDDRLQNNFGVDPRRLDGLDGIVFSPFLHVDFEHLAANSVPLILMGTFVLADGARRFLLSTALIALVGGIGEWLITDRNTVGASGVIFGYFGLLLARGFVERNWWNIGVSLLIGLVYGGLLLGVLPSDPSISWQGHLCGFIAGLIAAVVFRRRRRPRELSPPQQPEPGRVQARLAKLRGTEPVDA